MNENENTNTNPNENSSGNPVPETQTLETPVVMEEKSDIPKVEPDVQAKAPVIPNIAQNNFTGAAKPSSGMAIASMVLGIVAIVFNCISFISFPCAVIGLILGIISLRKNNIGAAKGMAIAGIVLTAIALVFAVIMLITAGALISFMPWADIIGDIPSAF